MNKKKVLLTVLAMVLICCLSITGTLAYLKDSQEGNDTVINTFEAAGGGIIINPTPSPSPTPPSTLKPGFFLVESKAEYVKPNYVLGDELVIENEYDKIVPGMDVPKDPKLYIDINNDVDAYIFIKVLDTTDGNLLYEVADVWEETSVSGVYVYKPASGAIITGVDGFELDGISLLDGDAAKAAETLHDIDTATEAMELGELKFQAFICQAGGFADYNEAFTKCFGS